MFKSFFRLPKTSSITKRVAILLASALTFQLIVSPDVGFFATPTPPPCTN